MESNGPLDIDDDFVFLNPPQDLPERPIPVANGGKPAARVEVELQNINPLSNEVLVSIKPPIQPLGSLQHTPCDIVLVIDVSASMSTPAELPDTADIDVNEPSGLSILDLVKHASRTILENLNDGDRLALVTFSTAAKVIQGLCPMTDDEKKATWSRIEELRVYDSTNLWAGIKEGLDIFSQADSIGNAQGVYILTDGVPNHLNPSQGFCRKLQPMLKFLEIKNGQAPVVSTFGFGYNLKSSLLRSIAEVGRGTFSFIPDVGMIGTVFVHAVANLFSTYATNAELTLECSNPAASVQAAAYLEFNTEESRNTTTLRLGNVQYGQSRDIIVKIHNASSMDVVKATFRYQTPRGPRNTLTAEKNLNGQTTLPRAVIDYHISRHELCAFLCSLSTKSQNGEHVALPASEAATRQSALVQLISNIESRLLASSGTDTTDLSSLLLDLKSNDHTNRHGSGQISLALQTEPPHADPPVGRSSNTDPSTAAPSGSPPPYSSLVRPMGTVAPGNWRRMLPFYTRWGQHYLPSILHAHALQLCTTFKDPGPLRYGINSPLFAKCRNELDDAFDGLPAPRPNLPQRNPRSAAGASPDARSSSRAVAMGRFNRVDNPCFTGECPIRRADGDILRVDEIRVGDVLWTRRGGRMVCGIVRTDVEHVELCSVSPPTGVTTPDPTLWITPWHPIFMSGTWHFPTSIATHTRQVSQTSIYSFILEKDTHPDAHTVEVGGVICVTLGHGLTQGTDIDSTSQQSPMTTSGNTDDIRAHPFFGDHDSIMASLNRLDRDECGRRVSGGIVRTDDSGLGFACAFLRTDELAPGPEFWVIGGSKSSGDHGGFKARL